MYNSAICFVYSESTIFFVYIFSMKIRKTQNFVWFGSFKMKQSKKNVQDNFHSHWLALCRKKFWTYCNTGLIYDNLTQFTNTSKHLYQMSLFFSRSILDDRKLRQKTKRNRRFEETKIERKYSKKESGTLRVK